MIVLLIFFPMALAGVSIWGLIRLFLWFDRNWPDWSTGKRLGVILMILAGPFAPYSAFKAWELSRVLARVPDPLRVSWIEYRHEESWGIGMPGDNETGLVVYRLTDGSAGWARSKGQQLETYLPGGAGQWHATPVRRDEDEDRWHGSRHEAAEHRHAPTIGEYLGRYGFSISVDEGRAAEIDHAIQSPGSFYSYGRGGSVTIIDPPRGKVYFAYAG